MLQEQLKSLAISFTMVTLAFVQFVVHSPPATDVVYIPALVVVIVIAIVILLPTVALFVVDRVLTIRDPRGRASSVFRVTIFAAAIVLIARAMFLYFGPVRDIIGPLVSLEALSVLFALVVVAASMWIARTWYEPLSQFFLWMTPVAAIVLIVALAEMVGTPPPAGYATETHVPSADAPPVFVFVFDELSYQVLADGDQIDAESFPNLSALASEGAWLTNATTNYFHTTFSVPPLVESVTPLSGEYQIRLYSQYGYVESLLYDGCGTQYTCRGQSHLAGKYTGSLVGDLLIRATYEATPRFVERVLDVPFSAIVDVLDTSLPSVDPKGIHTFSQEQWDGFMGDVSAIDSPGRLYFVHVLLPHTPFIYGEDGDITQLSLNTSYRWGLDRGMAYERYREQTSYVDALMGDFIARLKTEGLYEHSTIVVTGDHGLRKMSVATTLPIEMDQVTAQVPMIIKAPGVSPQVLDVDYQHVDFSKTLFDALGREATAGADGVSAFSTDRPDRDKVIFVDENNERYWEYVYRGDIEEWELVREVDGPLPSEPLFASAVPLTD
jgi:hypothetical protein